MEKETLEKDTLKWFENKVNQKSCSIMEAIEFGVKWQQERSYSEEEVLNIIQLFNDDFNMIQDTIPKWFEQFKKK